MKPASRASWKTLPFPDEFARLGYERSYSREQFQRIALGLIPEEMEDHWFVFHEAPWLYFHRSWTGIGVYALRLEPDGPCWRVREARASRDRSERGGAMATLPMSCEHDCAMLDLLVHQLIHRDDGVRPPARLLETVHRELGKALSGGESDG